MTRWQRCLADLKEFYADLPLEQRRQLRRIIYGSLYIVSKGHGGELDAAVEASVEVVDEADRLDAFKRN